MPQRHQSTLYLDHAATTPLHPDVLREMTACAQTYTANPSSLYAAGKAARAVLTQAKASIASRLGTTPEALVMTSGATEANNMALKGVANALAHKGRHIVTSQIEHPSVLETCRYLETQGFEVTYLPVTPEGLILPETLSRAIRPNETILVSLMHGNNEVGSLQDIASFADICRAQQVLFHCDAVQTVGKLPLDLSTLPIDLLSASAHKCYGPKGVGFLALSERARAVLPPLLHGGGQEAGLRSGTENIMGIVGMTKALEMACHEQAAQLEHLYTLQSAFISAMHDAFRPEDAQLMGVSDVKARVPGNVHYCFPAVSGESLVLRLDLAGIAVSSGSACHSAVLEGSHVLQAMGCSDAVSKTGLRVSFGRDNTLDDVDRVVAALTAIFARRETKNTLQEAIGTQ